MRFLNIEEWNRKEHFEFFMNFEDPFFGVTIPFKVTKALNWAKAEQVSFFATYLHACIKAINAVENFRYRITPDKQVVIHDVIHASPTMPRPDHTFGFSYIAYTEEFGEFLENYEAEKARVWNSTSLYPPETHGEDCIYCSALPWFEFTGHKEPFMTSNGSESVPKLAFSKTYEKDSGIWMNVALQVNHALVDGYHVGLFADYFQTYLNETKW